MKKRGIGVFLALMISLAAVFSLALVAWATDDDLEWVQVESYVPNAGDDGRKPLTAISFSSSSNGHAVGHHLDDGTSSLWQSQAQRWDGTSWEYVATQNQYGVDNFLYGVNTISSTDGWAVGAYEDAEFDEHALVLRYNYLTDAWVNNPVTVTGALKSVLTSVTSNSGTDVWAAGYYLPTTTGAKYRTLIMHWDGSSWAVVTSPNVDSGISPSIQWDNKLYGITNVPGSSNLFWAVGTYLDGNGNLKTLTMKGNTNSSPVWSVVSSVNGAGQYNCLRSVSAYDSSNIWAVGFQSEACLDLPIEDEYEGGSAPVLIEKGNGSSWSIENPPENLPNGTRLYGVSVASEDLVWAVGYVTNTVVLGRDDEGAWTRRPSASPGPPELDFNRLLGVDALSDTVAWAAGWYYAEEGGDKPTLIEHYVPPTPTP